MNDYNWKLDITGFTGNVSIDIKRMLLELDIAIKDIEELGELDIESMLLDIKEHLTSVKYLCADIDDYIKKEHNKR